MKLFKIHNWRNDELTFKRKENAQFFHSFQSIKQSQRLDWRWHSDISQKIALSLLCRNNKKDFNVDYSKNKKKNIQVV